MIVCPGPIKGFPINANIGAYLRVKESGGYLALAGATDNEIGVTARPLQVPTGGIGQSNMGDVVLPPAGCTTKGIASGAISQYAAVYAGANGKYAATGSLYRGIAMTATSADGDEFELLPLRSDPNGIASTAGGKRMAAGQRTTAAAVETIVTGLTTVTSVVVSFETDVADPNELVTAQIGDQAGSPAAGSIIIKTWKTDGTDPTPVASTSFSKKVNWIAFGT
jgi:hypothetical protein